MLDRIIDGYWAVYRFIRDMKYWHKEVKYAYQRVRYGISDKDCWSLDMHLCKILIRSLDTLANNNYGCPHEFFKNKYKGNECKEWSECLKGMRDGFKAGEEIIKEDYYFDKDNNIKDKEIREKEYNKFVNIFNYNFKNFHKYFFNLWD